MADVPTHGLIRRACAAVLHVEPRLTTRQIAARLKRQGLMTIAGRDVEQELLAAPAVFRRDPAAPARWSVDPEWRRALSEEPTLLRNLLIQNWKSFGSATLHFSDVTLIFGENSAGKSSILQALLMLKQTYRHGDFRFEGEFGSFGDLANVVHRHDRSAELKLIAGWEMQLEPGLVFIGLTAEAMEAVGHAEEAGRIKTIFYTALPLGKLPDTTPDDPTVVTPNHSTVSLTRTLFYDPDDELTRPAWQFAADIASGAPFDDVAVILEEDAYGWPGFDVVTTQAELDQGTVTATVRRSDDAPVENSDVVEGLPVEAMASLTQLASHMVKLLDDFQDSLDHFGRCQAV